MKDINTLPIIATLIILVEAFISLVLANENDTCQSSSPYILEMPLGYNHIKYAPAEPERIYDGGSFVSSVDSHDDDNGDQIPEYFAQPSWVASHIKSYHSNLRSYALSFKRPRRWYRIRMFNKERNEFLTNKRIDDSYNGVGNIWNRGHLAQRADANRIGQTYGCDTHVFANAVPQKAKFNQGIWLALENYISSLANQMGELWVVSGPIYEHGMPLETIGETKLKEIPVTIPDNLFKVVFIEGKYGINVISFIYPNKYEKIPDRYMSGNCHRDRHYDHTSFIVSLFEVEQASGLTFFPDDSINIEILKKMKATGLPPINLKNIVGYCM